jgi:hypothetical protein
MKSLKHNIKSTLKEISENKKKQILEYTIVSSRLTPLLENRNKKRLFVDLTQEINEMVNDGINKKQINEALSDIFTAAFGDESNKMFNIWKDQGVNWLLSKLELDSDAETASYIKKEFDKLPSNSIPGLFTDCDKVTDIVVNGLVEAFQNKIRMNSESSVSAVKILMNGVYDMTKDEKFQDIIESKIKSQICPLLSQIKTKMDNEEKRIKSGIISQNTDTENTSDVAV